MVIPAGSGNPFAWSELIARRNDNVAEQSRQFARRSLDMQTGDQMRRSNAALESDLALQQYGGKIGLDREYGINDFGNAAGQFDQSNVLLDDANADPYYAAVVGSESSGRGNAKNPLSSASGYNQIVDGTWRQLMTAHPELGLRPDGRGDPAQEKLAVRALTNDNARQLLGSGIKPTYGNLYAAHLLGAGGATSVLTQPDNTPLARILPPNVIRANPQYARMTVGGFRQFANRPFGAGGSFTRVSTGEMDEPNTVAIGDSTWDGLDPSVKDQYEPIIGAYDKRGRQRYRKKSAATADASGSSDGGSAPATEKSPPVSTTSRKPVDVGAAMSAAGGDKSNAAADLNISTEPDGTVVFKDKKTGEVVFRKKPNG